MNIQSKSGIKRNKGKSDSKKRVPSGVVHIKTSFNNTIITFTDIQGNVLLSVSGGSAGFKGTKKSSPFAATQAAEMGAAKVIAKYGLDTVEVCIRGIGSGREPSVRALAAHFNITSLRELTPIRHAGARPPKKRRV